MKTAFISLFSALFVFSSVSAVAQITFTDATVKQPVPGQAVSAGYFLAENLGNGSRTLVGVSSDGADRVEMHTHTHEDGVMSMKKVEYFDIPASAVLEFSPGGNHLMLFSPSEDALETGVINLEFQFDDGETIAVTAKVENWQ